MIWFFCYLLTNIDLEATHVLSVEVVSGILCVSVIIVLNEGVRTLFSKRTKGLRTRTLEEERT
jgi:hypothetical protein